MTKKKGWRESSILLITPPVDSVQAERAVGQVLRHVLRREETVEVARELCAILDLSLPQR